MLTELKQLEDGHLRLHITAESAAEAIALRAWVVRMFETDEQPKRASVFIERYPPVPPPPQPELPDGQLCYHCQRVLDHEYVGGIFWHDRWWCMKCLGQYE
jgi:hypothetical protein